jgi:hypothetical protein
MYAEVSFPCTAALRPDALRWLHHCPPPAPTSTIPFTPFRCCHLHERGYGLSSDAHHITALYPDGIEATLAMQRALQGSGRRQFTCSPPPSLTQFLLSNGLPHPPSPSCPPPAAVAYRCGVMAYQVTRTTSQHHTQTVSGQHWPCSEHCKAQASLARTLLTSMHMQPPHPLATKLNRQPFIVSLG